MQHAFGESKKNVIAVLDFSVTPYKLDEVNLDLPRKHTLYKELCDIDKKSYSYGKIVSEILSYDKCNQLFIPPGYAHGYCVLSDFAIVMYKCTDYYYPDDQKGIIWNDSDVNIKWPILKPIISEKDASLPSLLMS